MAVFQDIAMNFMTNRSVMTGVSVGVISWAVGYFMTLALSDGLSNGDGYAVVVGWWFCAYTASVFSVSLLASMPLGAIYFLIFIVTAIAGKSWLYHDVASLPLLSIFEVGLLQSLFVASPILFNRFFSFCVVFLKARLGGKSS